MIVTVQVDTADGTTLSAKDIKILRSIMGDASDLPEVPPAKKAAAAPAKKAAAAPEPDEVPEPTLDNAIEVGTKYLADGGAPAQKKIKAWLADAGVGRISMLEGDDIASFIAEFS